jgi:hypothetical protein
VDAGRFGTQRVPGTPDQGLAAPWTPAKVSESYAYSPLSCL